MAAARSILTGAGSRENITVLVSSLEVLVSATDDVTRTGAGGKGERDHLHLGERQHEDGDWEYSTNDW